MTRIVTIAIAALLLTAASAQANLYCTTAPETVRSWPIGNGGLGLSWENGSQGAEQTEILWHNPTGIQIQLITYPHATPAEADPPRAVKLETYGMPAGTYSEQLFDLSMWSEPWECNQGSTMTQAVVP